MKMNDTKNFPLAAQGRREVIECERHNFPSHQPGGVFDCKVIICRQDEARLNFGQSLEDGTRRYVPGFYERRDARLQPCLTVALCSSLRHVK
jgi:hypothetical protein